MVSLITLDTTNLLRILSTLNHPSIHIQNIALKIIKLRKERIQINTFITNQTSTYETNSSQIRTDRRFGMNNHIISTGTVLM